MKLFRAGVAAYREGRYAKAISNLRRHLSGQPDHEEARYVLALSYMSSDKFAEGERHLLRLLERAPNHDRALESMGRLCTRQGRFDEAEGFLKNSLAHNPKAEPTWLAAAELAEKRDRPQDAEQALREGLEINKNSVALRMALSKLLVESDFNQDADDAIQEAVELIEFANRVSPNTPPILNNLSQVYRKAGRRDQAIAAARESIALAPKEPLYRVTLADALSGISAEAQEEVVAQLQQAIELARDNQSLRWNLSMALLRLRRFYEAWPHFEVRLDRSFSESENFAGVPEWTGEPIENGSLLIVGEQGVGDQVLYTSMLPDLLGVQPDCVMMCDERMAPLMERSFPSVESVSHANAASLGVEINRLSAQVRIGSLGKYFRPSEASFPQHQGYLAADAEAAQRLRDRYEKRAQGRKIVGISWRSQKNRYSRLKSRQLCDWEPLLTLPDAMFVNLQYGECAEELKEIRDSIGVEIFHDNEVDPLLNLDLFASQVVAMDFVISVSNTTVHFAGALDKACWVLLPRNSGVFWYWGVEGEDCLWYPSVRLLREPIEGGPEDLMLKTREELERFAGASC